ncbi:MAG: hypothetical protein PHH69_06620 [Candidatus Omnitrophica bacterium]|nr:hypothetical protein [Candidatus Omnitrophota bacterium]MDD5611181.1 hypothetical protein [Candidatus Omnitrophota bacterium]
MKKILLVGLLGFFAMGCASVQPAQKSNLTVGMVNKTIVKGQTTQNDILQTFGAPNIITKNKSGKEVWTYDKVSSGSSGTSGYGTVLIAGVGGSSSSTSSQAFTLMITFNDNSVVEDYSMMSSAF